MSIQSDGKGFIAASKQSEGGVPLYRTEDMGGSWKPVNLPLNKGFHFSEGYLPEISRDGRGTVRMEYTLGGETVTEYFETTDNGVSWHRFDTATILDLEGDREALKSIKIFLDAWKNHNSKVLDTLWVEGKPILTYDWMWESGRKIHFTSVYPPSSLPDSQSLIIGALYHVTSEDGDDRTGVMAVGVRKQDGTDVWKVYFLD